MKVEQAGRVRMNRLYGARNNVKIWPFGERLQKEVAWSWGAGENMVWEGHDAYADLDRGPAKITLLAGRQPAPQARRNVDLVMLTRDEAQIRERLAKEGYLPLDGMLTQAGNVWARLRNRPDGSTMSLTLPNGTEHSPYWVHQRKWKPVVLKAGPDKTTDWTEVGSLLDTLNDGQWNLQAAPAEKDRPLHYKLELGVSHCGRRDREDRRVREPRAGLASGLPSRYALFAAVL